MPHPVDADMKEFFEKHVPASCIPSDYGGDLPSLQELADGMFKEIRRRGSLIEMDEKQVQLYTKEK